MDEKWIEELIKAAGQKGASMQSLYKQFPQLGGSIDKFKEAVGYHKDLQNGIDPAEARGYYKSLFPEQAATKQAANNGDPFSSILSHVDTKSPEFKNDPAAVILKPFQDKENAGMKSFENVRNQQTGIRGDQTLQKLPVPAQIDNNGKPGDLPAAKQHLAAVEKTNLVQTAIKNQLFQNGKEAGNYLGMVKAKNGGVIPAGNQTAQLAEERYNRYAGISDLLNKAPNIEAAAIDYARSNDYDFNKKLSTITGQVGGNNTLQKDQFGTTDYNKLKLDRAMIGRKIYEFVNDPDVQAAAQDNPALKAQVSAFSGDKVFLKYPETAVNLIRNEVSWEREHQGKNNIVANPVFDNSAKNDEIVDQLYKNRPIMKAIAEKYLKGNWEGKLATHGVVDDLGTGMSNTLGQAVNTLTFKHSFMSDADIAKEALKDQYNNVDYQFHSWRDDLAGAANMAGMVATMGAGGNVLGGVYKGITGAEMSPTVANAINTGTFFYDQEVKDWKEKYPGEAWKAYLGAILSTTSYMAASHIVPKGEVAKKVIPEMKGAIADAVNNLGEKSVQDAAAYIQKSLPGKFAEIIKDAASHSAKGAGEMAAITLFKQGLDKTFGLDQNTYNRVHPANEIVDVAKSMFLGGLLPNMVTAYGSKSATADQMLSFAKFPERYTSVLQDNASNADANAVGKRIEDIQYLSKVKSQLDANGTPEENQKAYLLYSMAERQAKEELSGQDDNNIKASIKEKIKKIEELKQKIWDGKKVDVEKEPIPGVKDEKPTVESAVITIGGKTYEGKNHAEAILNAKADGQDISNVDRKAEGKFKLSDGTIIDRAEAKKMFGNDRSELLIDQDQTAKDADKEYARMKEPETPAETAGEKGEEKVVVPEPVQPEPAKPEQTVKSFADRLVSGEKMKSAEDLQFYDNNKSEIEAELKSRQNTSQNIATEKKPFSTKKYTVEYNDNGDRIIKDKEGKEVPRYVDEIQNVKGRPVKVKKSNPVWNRVALKHAKSLNYNSGETAKVDAGSVSSESEATRMAIETSQNPSEIADIWMREPRTPASLSSKEQAIANAGIGKVKQASFEEHNDPNNITGSIAKNYFRKDGRSLDQIAHSITNETGVEVGPEDVAEYMIRFPYGKDADATEKTDNHHAAETKFQELTGVPLNETTAEIAAKQFYSKEETKTAEKQADEQPFREYDESDIDHLNTMLQADAENSDNFNNFNDHETVRSPQSDKAESKTATPDPGTAKEGGKNDVPERGTENNAAEPGKPATALDRLRSKLGDEPLAMADNSPEAKLKTAQSELSKAQRELKTAEDKLAQKQATQTGMFSDAKQGEMFGVSRDEAKSILDPLKKKVAEAKTEVDRLQKEVDSKSGDNRQGSLFLSNDDPTKRVKLSDLGIDPKDDTATVLQKLIDHGGPFTDLLKMIQADPNLSKVNIKLFDHGNNRESGLYHPQGHEKGGELHVWDKANTYYTLTHELMHFFTIDGATAEKVTGTEGYETLKKMYDFIADRMEKPMFFNTNEKNYGLTNFKEFMAELLINEKFRNHVSDVFAEHSKDILKGGNPELQSKSLIDVIKDFFRDLWNKAFGQSPVIKNYDNSKPVIDNAVNLATELFFGNADVKPGKESAAPDLQKAAMPDFKQQKIQRWVDEERKMGTDEAEIRDALKQYGVDEDQIGVFMGEADKTTSIKNETVNKEREQRGKEPVEKVGTGRSDKQVAAEARQLVDDGKVNPQVLTNSIIEEPREISDVEVHILLNERVRLTKEYEAAVNNLLDAQEKGDKKAISLENLRVISLEEQIDANDKAADYAGTKQAQAFRARQLLKKRNYELAAIVQRARAASGKEVDPETRKQLAEWQKKYAEAEQRYNDYMEAQSTHEQSLREEIERLKKQRPTRTSTTSNPAKIKAERAAITSQILDVMHKLDRVNTHKMAAFDPERKSTVPTELKKPLKDLMKGFVMQGVNTADGVVDAIHKHLADHGITDIEKRDIRDAVSGYGEQQKLSKEKIDVQLRDLRRQQRLISALEDAQAGQRPQRSGLEREEPSQEVRSLQKQVMAEMRKHGLDDQRTDEDKWKTALQAYKTRTKNAIEDMTERLDSGNYVIEKAKPVVLDAEAMALKSQREKLKAKIDAKIEELRLANRSKFEKVLDFASKFGRAVKLSGITTTLPKLSTAAMARQFIFSPIESGTGLLINNIPGLSKVADQARREGARSVTTMAKAEAASMVNFFSKKTFADAWDVLKNGKGELDRNFGKKTDLPQEWIEFFGRIHGAIKTPAKRAEFQRSMALRIEWCHRNGIDPNSPEAVANNTAGAYADANRAIFMQKSLIDSRYRQFIHSLETSKDSPRTGKAVATLLKILFPIVKVPVNFVRETTSYSIGGFKALPLLAKATIRGADRLTPEQADYIMRNLKKQTVGGALMALGYLMPGAVGGYYTGPRKEDDLKSGDVSLFGFHLPHWALHMPAIEVLQMGATLRRVHDSMGSTDNEVTKYGEGLWQVTKGVSKQIPFLEQPAQIVEATKDSGSFMAWLGSTAKSYFIPPDVQKIATSMDAINPTSVGIKPEGFIDALEYGIPWVRQQAIAKAYDELMEKRAAPTKHKTFDEKQAARDKKDNREDKLKELHDALEQAGHEVKPYHRP